MYRVRVRVRNWFRVLAGAKARLVLVLGFVYD